MLNEARLRAAAHRAATRRPSTPRRRAELHRAARRRRGRDRRAARLRARLPHPAAGLPRGPARATSRSSASAAPAIRRRRCRTVAGSSTLGGARRAGAAGPRLRGLSRRRLAPPASPQPMPPASATPALDHRMGPAPQAVHHGAEPPDRLRCRCRRIPRADAEAPTRRRLRHRRRCRQRCAVRAAGAGGRQLDRGRHRRLSSSRRVGPTPCRSQ